jgi:hypothetical protein
MAALSTTASVPTVSVSYNIQKSWHNARFCPQAIHPANQFVTTQGFKAIKL